MALYAQSRTLSGSISRLGPWGEFTQPRVETLYLGGRGEAFRPANNSCVSYATSVRQPRPSVLGIHHEERSRCDVAVAIWPTSPSLSLCTPYRYRRRKKISSSNRRATISRRGLSLSNSGQAITYLHPVSTRALLWFLSINHLAISHWARHQTNVTTRELLNWTNESGVSGLCRRGREIAPPSVSPSLPITGRPTDDFPAYDGDDRDASSPTST